MGRGALFYVVSLYIAVFGNLNHMLNDVFVTFILKYDMFFFFSIMPNLLLMRHKENIM